MNVKANSKEKLIKNIDCKIRPVLPIVAQGSKTAVEIFVDVVKGNLQGGVSQDEVLKNGISRGEKSDYKRPFLIAGKALGILEGVRRVLLEYDVQCVIVESFREVFKVSADCVGLCILDLDKGFACEDFTVFSAKSIFGSAVTASVTKKKKINLKKLSIQAHSFQEGDLVTHLDHGIGLFTKIECVEHAGRQYEMICLEYKNKNMLFVPIYMLDMVSKYDLSKAGYTEEEKLSMLDKLGSKSWENRKTKVKKNLFEMADKIVKMVAESKLSHGMKFFPISGLMDEFVKNRGFALTDDQILAIDDINKDFASGAVMDRLICGDVGYGKTEVAMMASFLAVHGKMVSGDLSNKISSNTLNKGSAKVYEEAPDRISAEVLDKVSDQTFSKASGEVDDDCYLSSENQEKILDVLGEAVNYEFSQVAVVAPTTILVKQHCDNFRKRFEGTGIRIAEISRRVTASEKKCIIKDLEAGKIDILIGTHALFSDKIKFHKLGLLIIDEEQHFGVKQKDKLRESYVNAHVLLLSATPIPRTLQMSLSGIKDISIIATPPFDRLLSKSFLINFDKFVISQAVVREKSRSGRVFFVCPRIQDIELQKLKLEEIFEGTGIKIGVAHGKMSTVEMEDSMLNFFDGRYDILVTTNIIESGLDISFANTIFIYNAEMFGMSSLHQLRGRVGRSNVQAYAYFIVDKLKMKNPNTAYKLKNVLSVETVAAGFKIASFDMDTRGAGNLLGDKQSGHINEIGVELYQKMLQEAVAKAKNVESRKIEEKSDDDEAVNEQVPEVKIGISTFIPREYILDSATRIEFYRRLASATSNEELNEIIIELGDRFGSVPQGIMNLCDIVEVRIRCKNLGITKIEVGENGSLIYIDENRFKKLDELFDIVSKPDPCIVLRPDGGMFLRHEEEVNSATREARGKNSKMKNFRTREPVSELDVAKAKAKSDGKNLLGANKVFNDDSRQEKLSMIAKCAISELERI